MSLELIFGLGNPGARYEGTRHNIGFLALDRLRERLDSPAGPPEPFRTVGSFEGEVARVGPVRLVKPQTFMNLSGRTVRSVCHFFKTPPESILVIYDDMDLSWGTLRFRARGSAGGHNGIRSIIECLGTQNFPRLKVGIGRGERADSVGHVLGKFSSDERADLDRVLDRTADAVRTCLSEGMETAMNRFHGPAPEA